MGGAEGHFGLVDTEGKGAEYALPGDDTSYETGWSVQTLPMTHGEEGLEVRFVAFHEGRGVYVVACSREVGFVLPSEEQEEEGGREKEREMAGADE
ncbi:mRNA cleavage and polyadenylation factor subunit, partial [Teratosphaeriaceae sp. CCFEE 6253]